MKHKKLIIILVAVVFFITALTFYANRVIFPQMIRKIAIENAQTFLKRKVEIEAIHFNWVKGFIIDKVKIYQKDSTTNVFAQVERLSFGVIIIPGVKQHKITIPFINVEHPSAQLIRNSETTWNFSDLIPAATPNSAPAKDEKPSPFAIAIGVININNGQLRVDDISSGSAWTELFDAINLKMSLSLNGIDYDFSTSLPQKNGYLAAKGSYQPITQAVHTDVKLKNINTSSYLNLIKINGLTLHSGLIDAIDLHIDYSKEKIGAQGDASLKNIDLILGEQHFKGNVEIRHWDTEFSGGPGKAKGEFAITQGEFQEPGISASGNWRGNINTLGIDKDNINFEGSLTGDNVNISMADDKTVKGQIALNNIKLRKDKDGSQLVGTLITKNLDIRWINQHLTGDLSLKPLTMRMKDADHIELLGDLLAEHLKATMDADKSFGGSINAQDIQLTILNKKDIALTTKLSIDSMMIALGETLKASANIKAEKLQVKFSDDTLKLATATIIQDGHVTLDGNKSIAADPRLELSLEMPLKNPSALSYTGSLTVSNVHIEGFPYAAMIKNIELDTDFKTDEATLNALSVNILDTDLRATGTIKDFKNPLLNITAEANDLNLTKIKELAPDLIKQYGLDIDGSSTLKVKFEGLASKPLDAKIQAIASLKKVNVTSSKLKQNVHNITGIVEATPDSLQWRDFTATYLDHQYTLTGGLTDFKNPKITTSLDGKEVQLKADIAKNGDDISINELTGKYLNIGFGLKGSATLPQGGNPVVDIDSTVTFTVEDALNFLPANQREGIDALKLTGSLTLASHLKGPALDWKNWDLNATLTSPLFAVMNYKMQDIKVNLVQSEQKVKSLTLDGTFYSGKVHAVSSIDLTVPSMPFDLALNIDEVDLKELKADSPLKTEDVKGKFYLTSVANGGVMNIKNLHAKGSFAIREGFLAEFKIFKGLLGILNEALRLGQVMITDVESNFTIDNQRMSTDNLRLKSPTIVLLGEGWVDFNQDCDLKFGVDMSSGIVPPIAEEVLRTLQVHIYDKITNPKFDKKISVPQVINSIIKTIGIFQ